LAGSQPNWPKVASDARAILNSHAHSVENLHLDADKLVRADWEQDWKLGVFVWPPVCSLRDVLDAGEEERLGRAVAGLVEFVVDGSNDGRCRSIATRLAESLREYLRWRGWRFHDSTQGQGAAPIPPREEVKRQLEPAVRKAYLALQYAESFAEKRLEDREAHSWLRDNGIDQGNGDLGELTDYKLPSLETFRRYLSTARSALGENRYTRRGGRKHGGSIVSGNKIEYQKGDGA